MPTKIQKEYWYVVAAGILSGTVVFGGEIFRGLGLSLFQLSTLPFFFSILALTPFILQKKLLKIPRGFLWVFLAFGLIDALLIICQFGALYLGASVAVTVLLLYTQPLWTVILNVSLFNEKLTLRRAFACIFVLLGVFLLTNPLHQDIGNIVGIFVALLGGISLSCWVTLGSYVTKRGNPPLNTLYISRFAMLFFLFIAFPILGLFVKDNEITRFSLSIPWHLWIYLIIFGCTAELFNNLLYLKGVKKVSAIDAGIILLLEPIAGVILAAIFLHQPVTFNLILGGALILLANYLVIVKGTKNG